MVREGTWSRSPVLRQHDESGYPKTLLGHGGGNELTVSPAHLVAGDFHIAACKWRPVLDRGHGDTVGWSERLVVPPDQSPRSADRESFHHTGGSSSYSARSSSRGVSEWNVPGLSGIRSASACPNTSARSLDQWWNVRGFAERTRRKNLIFDEYSARIDVLRSDGEFEEITLEAASERDFWYFVKSKSFTRRAQLVLMDSGNLRAVWKSPEGAHLGLQFLGRRKVEYVIFKRRPATSDVSRVAGVDTLDGVARQIDAFDLASLVNM